MAKKYDLMVIGAGPGGLMAARVAAENGLAVALLERKQNITKVKRSCATMFAIEDDYFFGERMFFNAARGRLVFPVNGFSVKYDGPYKNFYGQMLYAPDGKACVQIGDSEAAVTKGDPGRLSVVYDKESLLQGMLKEARETGVEIFEGANVVNILRDEDKVQVKTSEDDCFEGTFVIAADGINSRTANLLGFNQQRTHYGTVITVSYEMTGARPPAPFTYKMATVFEKKHGIPLTFGMVPRAAGEDTFWVFIGGPADDRIDYAQAFQKIMTESPFVSWYQNAHLSNRQSAVINFWSPIEEPFRDNVLIIGDAAWCIEAEITGAIMCGWKAAQAVTVALRDKKSNREGVRSYLKWWKESFLNYDYKGYLKSLAMFYVLTEEDARYVFSLLNKPLPATLSPHKIQELFGAAIMEQLPKIQAERPGILQRFQQLEETPLEELLKPLTRLGQR